MSVLYIKEQRATIRKRGTRLLVEKEDKVLLEIPIRQTESVAIYGNVQVTTQAMIELLDNNVPLAIYTRTGRLRGHLMPESSKNAELRVEQYRCSTDPARSLAIARSVVSAKVRNSAALIAGYRTNYPSGQ